eukprot:5547791-Prymnesium_polylepis.1
MEPPKPKSISSKRKQREPVADESGASPSADGAAAVESGAVPPKMAKGAEGCEGTELAAKAPTASTATTCMVSKKLVRAPGASWGLTLSPVNKITSVTAGSAAAHAGLLSGDTVVGLSTSLESGVSVSVASLNGGSSTNAAAQAIRRWTNALGQPTDTLCIHVVRRPLDCSAEQSEQAQDRRSRMCRRRGRHAVGAVLPMFEVAQGRRRRRR